MAEPSTGSAESSTRSTAESAVGPTPEDAGPRPVDPSASARHARLSELFAEAIELARAEREALVVRVREEDAPLGAELAELLAADASAATALRTGGFHAPTPTTFVDPSAGKRELPPLVIRGYKVRERLGEGGMGTVYAGEQESPVRPVAIKVLHASTGPALARFWGEAAIMARLDHPGIARVLEAGEANGHPFIVMEHVDGATLDAHVRAAQPTLAARLSLFAAICDAVHHAHLNGVIHRDLKPKNVMVRPDGRVVVLDFGIARAANATKPRSSDGDATCDDLPADTSATRAGDLMGTPVYMSPEQARLRPDEVDARSDVYSLGVVLHELVSGELPYPVRDIPVAAVAAMVCEEPPAALLALGFDRDLDAIARTALAKEPPRRYQSAAALADDIRAWLDGRAVSVRTPGTLEQLRRIARRRPLLAFGAAGGVVMTIAFAAIVTNLWLDAREAHHTAETARAKLAARTATLTLQQARARVSRDPTEALALLADVHSAGLDPLLVEVIAEEARGRGVASHVLHEHRDEVHWVEELRDGALVTAGYDGAVRLWDKPYATSRVLFQEPRGRAHVARPSPDGRLFAIGGDAGALHIVDRDGRLRTALAGHTGDVERIVWSAEWLVTADDRGGVIAWFRGAPPARRLVGATSKIESLSFSQRNDHVIAGEESGAAWLWALGATHTQSFAMNAAIRSARVTTDRTVAAAADGSVQRWRGVEPEGDTIETRVPSKRAAITPDGRVVVLAGIDGSVVRIDGERVDILGSHATKVRGLAIDPTGRRVASGSEDGVIQVWDNQTGRHLTLRGHRQRIRQLVFAQSSDTLLSSDGEGVVRVWPLDAIPGTFFDDHHAQIEHLGVSADGRTVVSTDAVGAIVLADLASGASRPIGRSTAHITAASVAGGVPITGDVKGMVTWWRGGAPTQHSVGSAVRMIAATHDGARIAVATADGPIVLFDGAGEPAGRLAGHAGGTDGVTFDRSGLLASGGQDRSVRLWRDGAQVAELAGQGGDTHVLRFAPDGSVLVAGCDDGVVRAWTLRAGVVDPQSRRTLGEHAGAVTAIAFDASGRRVATAARDAGFIVADLATGTVDRAAAPHRNAIAIAIDITGRVLFASETGDLDRWLPPSAPTTIPVNQGTSAAAALPDGRILLGGTDGSVRAIGR